MSWFSRNFPRLAFQWELGKPDCDGAELVGLGRAESRLIFTIMDASRKYEPRQLQPTVAPRVAREVYFRTCRNVVSRSIVVAEADIEGKMGYVARKPEPELVQRITGSTKKIKHVVWIERELPTQVKVSTLFHEVAHIMLGHSTGRGYWYEDGETESELTSAVLCHRSGIDTTMESTAYLASEVPNKRALTWRNVKHIARAVWNIETVRGVAG